MHFIVRSTLTFLLSCIVCEGYAQLILNPSFEGPPQTDAAPSPWIPCNTFSTPDTQPGSWNVTKTASDGNTYLGLVTRGDLGPYANHTEAAQIQLGKTLIA